MEELDIDALLLSWVLTMKAKRKLAGTIKNYTVGVRRFLFWCETEGSPKVVGEPTVTAYIADSVETCEVTTSGGRLVALEQLPAWVTEEGENPVARGAGLRQRELDSKLIQPLSDDELRALLKICNSAEFGDRRAQAIIRFMIKTAARANEVFGLEVPDVHLTSRVAAVRRGRGGKCRTAPFGLDLSVHCRHHLGPYKHHSPRLQDECRRAGAAR